MAEKTVDLGLEVFQIIVGRDYVNVQFSDPDKAEGYGPEALMVLRPDDDMFDDAAMLLPGQKVFVSFLWNEEDDIDESEGSSGEQEVTD